MAATMLGACQNIVSLSIFLTVVFILIISNRSIGDAKESSNEFTRKSSIKDERPFRMSKINILWEKAKKSVAVDELPNLYADLVVHDRLEVDWKKQKSDGLDEDGEQEALIRRKLLAILKKFNIGEIYKLDPPSSSFKNSVGDGNDDPDALFQEALKTDVKLAKIWKKAELSGFSAKELAALKVEFGHHMEKVEEYSQLRTEIDRLEGIHENSIERFKSGVDEHASVKDKHSALKKSYRDIKRSYESLEQMADQTQDSDEEHPWIKDSRIRELWALAVKSNLSETQLTSFREELSHFEKKIRKFEYYEKEAEISRANFHQQGKDSNDIPEFHSKLEDKVKEYSLKVKKWYTELKSRILKSNIHHEL